MKLVYNIFLTLLLLTVASCGCSAPVAKTATTTAIASISADTVLRMQPPTMNEMTPIELTSLSQLNSYIKPMLIDIKNRKASILKELKETTSQDKRDAIFEHNRFCDIKNIEDLIFNKIHKFSDSLTFENSSDWPKELDSTAELLKQNDYIFYFYPPGEQISRLEVNAQAEYDFYKPYVSPKYQSYLWNLSYNQIGGEVVFDAWVALPMDSVLIRMDRWGKCLHLFDQQKEPISKIHEDVKTHFSTYVGCALYCNLDNSPTFDYNNDPSKILPYVLTSIKEAFAKLKPEHKYARQIVSQYLTMLESNDWCYNRNVELYMWNYAYDVVAGRIELEKRL